MKYAIAAGLGLIGLTFLILAFVLIIVLHPNGQVSLASITGASGESGMSGSSVTAKTLGFFASTTTAHTLSATSFVVLSGQNDVLNSDISTTMQSQHYLVPYDLTFGTITGRGTVTNSTGSDLLVHAQMYRADGTVTGGAGPIGTGLQFLVPASSTTSFPSTTVPSFLPVSVTRGERLSLVLSSDGVVTIQSYVGSASWAPV